MKLTYSYDKYIIIINKTITRDVFLQSAGAGKGYSRLLFNKIFNCIFSELINLEDEYTKYYSVEFDSFGEYLFKKYNLSNKNIEGIFELKKENVNNVVYRKEDSHLWLENFIYSETNYESIMNLLLMRKQKNEN